jgi:hypothetical protein
MALRAPGRSPSLAITPAAPANINTAAANSGINILAASTNGLGSVAQHPAIASLASRELARKASLNALTAATQTSPTTTTASAMSRMGADGREIAVGDVVDVPGDMHGLVKFVGSVRGKKGVFAGVELAKEFASRGKNDGDVDG